MTYRSDLMELVKHPGSSLAAFKARYGEDVAWGTPDRLATDDPEQHDLVLYHDKCRGCNEWLGMDGLAHGREIDGRCLNCGAI